jgi:hypothetical protein
MNLPRQTESASPPQFGTELKSKHKLLSAAKRCLEDEKCYRFFTLLDGLSQLPEDDKKAYIEDIAMHGAYDDEEIGALRRLIVDGGAHAFKHLVDVVRDIRVKQEIDSMLK